MWGSVPGAAHQEWLLSNRVSNVDEFLHGPELLMANPDLPAAANNEIAYAAAMQYYMVLYRNRAEDFLDILSQ